MRWSSLSAKIFVAVLVVMAAFGGVSGYAAVTMRRLGAELRLLSRGYLTLRLELQDLQAHQLQLLQLIERPDDEPQRAPAFVKGAIDFARAYRRKNLRQVREVVDRLIASARDDDEGRFLGEVGVRLATIAAAFDESELLFDRVWGPPLRQPMGGESPAAVEGARQALLGREQRLWKRDLGELTRDLRGRQQEAVAQLERDERRAIWATLLLSLAAALVGAGVLLFAKRTLEPLRRLAATAKLLGGGDYRQRVPVGADDEVGTLAREFNAMAAALQEREQRLIRSERLAAVGKIAAQITHEVRNPLSSIGLNAELLEEEIGEERGEARELVRAIVKEVDRLGAITEQYLRFARLPRPKLEIEEITPLIASLLVFQRQELAGRGIATVADLAPELPPVAVDESQLRQALLNLIRNAAEAMPGGGALTVATTAQDDEVRIAISDRGEGIPGEHRDKIFDAFFSTKRGGTGLGLALTQQIIVEHGGTIDVESSPGQGTTFTVRLPAQKRQLLPARDPPAPLG